MTREELDAIQARCEAATPGPWICAGEKGGNPSTSVSSWHDNLGYHIHTMAWVEKQTPNVFEPMRDVYIRDAIFIAHSREDIPALLAEIERLTVKIYDEITAAFERGIDVGKESEWLIREISPGRET